MTDPTGRHAADAVPPPGPEEPQGVRTDLDVHPAVDVPKPYTRGTLESEEGEIKDGILRMGSLVAERIVAAIDALENHDADAATAIIENDRDINAMERQISDLIRLTIATQQPVARDLRFLLTLDHVAYDLERMGDYASSVAKQARKLAPIPPLRDYVHLPEMGRLAASLVRDVLGAVVEVDAERARAVARRDDDVDELYHAIFEEALDLMRADPANVDTGARILFAAHYIERVGDRVTNIAEDVVFLATGEVTELNE
ncbi:MAG: phosphate signaling complex protein PhoU [Chloroflexota bacterium]|nr:phosphate signaling complex protein PhoU [Chloroflexota bacterium]